MTSTLDTFTTAYIEAALWSSLHEDGRPLDDNYGPEDIHPDTLAEMVEDCEAFQRDHADDIGDRAERAGHDFWLTRNRHGAGFWDGDWAHDVGRRLTDAAHVYGSVDLYLGDDGMIHA
jgi:hypothetical protein